MIAAHRARKRDSVTALNAAYPSYRPPTPEQHAAIILAGGYAWVPQPDVPAVTNHLRGLGHDVEQNPWFHGNCARLGLRRAA